MLIFLVNLKSSLYLGNTVPNVYKKICGWGKAGNLVGLWPCNLRELSTN